MTFVTTSFCLNPITPGSSIRALCGGLIVSGANPSDLVFQTPIFFCLNTLDRSVSLHTLDLGSRSSCWPWPPARRSSPCPSAGSAGARVFSVSSLPLSFEDLLSLSVPLSVGWIGRIAKANRLAALKNSQKHAQAGGYSSSLHCRIRGIVFLWTCRHSRPWVTYFPRSLSLSPFCMYILH